MSIIINILDFLSVIAINGLLVYIFLLNIQKAVKQKPIIMTEAEKLYEASLMASITGHPGAAYLLMIEAKQKETKNNR